MNKSTVKMKIGFMAFILILFCLGLSFASPCGDVNSSGTIDIIDALLVAQYYVGLDLSNFDQNAADVNGDSSISIVDALLHNYPYQAHGRTSSWTPKSSGTPRPRSDDSQSAFVARNSWYPGIVGRAVHPRGRAGWTADISRLRTEGGQSAATSALYASSSSAHPAPRPAPPGACR